jgi:hypothetical protein
METVLPKAVLNSHTMSQEFHLSISCILLCRQPAGNDITVINVSLCHGAIRIRCDQFLLHFIHLLC